MAVRSVLVLLAAAGLVTSVSAVAVGLGELRLQSTINQPLSAEIELLSVEGREASQLRARLGTPEDFARAGLERSHALTGLSFRPVLDAADGPVLKVVSHQAVREPFLDFLVRLEWPDGQLLRAYTVLLDLPKQDVQPPLARQPGPATFDNHQSPRRSLGVAPLRRPAISPGSGRYTVRPGDTLWSVASRARPQGATVQQTLMAIYRRNPDAFIDGDMNRMRRDYALQVPEPSEVAAVDANDARAMVWREAGEGLAPALSTALVADAASAEWAGATDDTAAGQLRLAAPQGGVASDGTSMVRVDSSTSAGVSASSATESGGSISGDVSSETQDANGVLAGASAAEKILYLEEEVLLTRRENRELHERIDNLEEQIDVMSRLVELQSGTVAAAQLPEQPQPAEVAAAPEPAAADVGDVTGAESGMFSKAWLALGGLAVLLLGGMVVRKRRDQQRDELAAPGLFMTHDEAEGRLSAGEEDVSGSANVADNTVAENNIADNAEVNESAPSVAFAPEESSESLEVMTWGDGEARNAASWEEQKVVEPSLDALEPEFDLDLDLDIDRDPDRDLSDFDFASLDDPREESMDSLPPEMLEAAPELTVPGVEIFSGAEEASAASDALPLEDVHLEKAPLEKVPLENGSLEKASLEEVSLDEWFAGLAEESPSGQNTGLKWEDGEDNADLENTTTLVASNSDYRVATTFDLDFAAFSDEGDALAQRDPSQTRLELARVYIDMQDAQSAKEILEELVMSPDQDVQRDARELLHSLE